MSEGSTPIWLPSQTARGAHSCRSWMVAPRWQGAVEFWRIKIKSQLQLKLVYCSRSTTHLLVRHRISIICWCIWWKKYFPILEKSIRAAHHWCLHQILKLFVSSDITIPLSVPKWWVFSKTSIRKWGLHILWEQKHAQLGTNCSDSDHHRSIWRLCISWQHLCYARSSAS